MPTPNVKVSVIIAAKNCERFIEATIKSIVEQTFIVWELIIVNDGSTDKTGQIAEKYASQDSRIHVIHQTGLGCSASRANAILQSSGEYIAVIDGDDIALPGRLESQVRFLDAHPLCVAVGGQTMQIDVSGNEIGSFRAPLTNDEILKWMLKGIGSGLIQTMVMFRRSAYDSAGGYRTDLRISEDLDLYFRLLSQGDLANLDETLGLFRRYPTSLTAQLAAEGIIDVRALIVARFLSSRGMKNGTIQISSHWQPESQDEYRFRLACNLARKFQLVNAIGQMWKVNKWWLVNGSAFHSIKRAYKSVRFPPLYDFSTDARNDVVVKKHSANEPRSQPSFRICNTLEALPQLVDERSIRSSAIMQHQDEQ